MTTELDPKLTFDSFVVGPANRLASAAARRAADAPGTSYNPLFIYSASGLGKTHILAAVAHHSTRLDPKHRVLYQALEGYLEDLTDALESGRRDDLKERYRDLDVLLLDDVQFLAGQAEAQEMLLGTLDALTATGSQIVLASDRPPADINGLDARLVSRFSGGLIVDIGAPEYETRVAILRKKAEEQGQSLEPGVAEALARVPVKNVRELGGALNRILAVQDLEGRSVAVEEVPALMGEAAAEVGADDFGAFMDEIQQSVAQTVEEQEAPWRKAFRQTAEATEREGFSARRLRTALESEREPGGWEEMVEGFRGDIQRLREIDEELDRLGNPWPEAAQGVVKDPERLEEAEALLASVRERTRPFPKLPGGPDLDGLEGVSDLALKAALQLVTEARPKYNPLFLWGPDPTGANAVLAAAGRTFSRAAPELRMAVTSVADFAEDFIRALSAGVAGAWRERWWTVDLLLVHGAEALAETERAQDEFFHLFEALKRRGSRVLLTSDRAPAGIPNIDERLRSRFEGGLVLEVPADGVPAAVADLRLEEGGAEAGASVAGAAGSDGEKGVIPPLDQIDMEGGRGGLFQQGDMPDREEAAAADVEEVREPQATPGTAGWMPTREKAVWDWPSLVDRLVEDLD